MSHKDKDMIMVEAIQHEIDFHENRARALRDLLTSLNGPAPINIEKPKFMSELPHPLLENERTE